MALPTWPISTHSPQQDSFSPVQRALDPISTDFEGGNTRERPRPGDNVGTLQQKIRLSMADHDTVVEWIKSTLGNGTGRFTMSVWLGSAFVTKVVQFQKPGSTITYSYVSEEFVDMGMTLRVFDV